MGRSQYKIYETHFPYFLTSTIADSIPLFSDPEIAQLILDGLVYMQTSRDVEIYAYVLMENHIHFIARDEELIQTIQNFKSFTAHQIVAFLNNRNRYRILQQLKRAKLRHKSQSKYQVWQEGYHPKQINTHEMMIQKIEYIHNNPVKRGYVDFPEQWRYSSARNYLDSQALIPVTLYER
jgi:REP element-mobilizing transposase RayT